MVQIIQRARPDVLLVNEFDYDAEGRALELFATNYLEVGQGGAEPIDYPYRLAFPSNTGVASGFDLNNNGVVADEPGEPGYGDDALGFGLFPGQYAFAVYSRYPIDAEAVRTLQTFLWADMPGALLPDETATAQPGDCTTMVAMLPLKALHDAFGLLSFTATSLQAAGGAGQKGMDELLVQVPALLAEPDLLRTDGAAAAKLVEHAVHHDTLAFNVVPLLGGLADDGYTDEERKLVNESRKILGLPDLVVTPTCIRVPVMVGHCVAVRASFEDP